MSVIRVVNDYLLEDLIVGSDVGFLLVAFTTAGSVPCKHFLPEYEKVCMKSLNALFVRIEADENPSLTKILEVTAVPTTLLYRDGRLLGRWEGPYTAEALTERLRLAIKEHGRKSS